MLREQRKGMTEEFEGNYFAIGAGRGVADVQFVDSARTVRGGCR
jgi:hypothetical protein